MRILIQRVKEANVMVNSNIVGEIGRGISVFVGITHDDTEKEAEYLSNKLCNLRIFEDENGKMNLSIKDVGGRLLIIPQFTLYANCEKGNRPSFSDAGNPEIANKLYEYFCEKCKEKGIEVQKGIFGENMEVNIKNDGPVTISLEKAPIQ